MTKNNNETPETAGTHRWEIAFGPAPYRFTGTEEKKYQAIPGDPNCPVQPGGSCDWCGQALYTLCHFVSADGTKFHVGSDCALKSGDAGMKKAVNKVKSGVREGPRDGRGGRTVRRRRPPRTPP